MTVPVRVLLVDDQDLVRGGLAAILKASALVDVVADAANGLDAVRLAAEHRPDVVLMDIEMPGGDGLTATSAILKSSPDTKIIILTTFDLDEYVYLALRTGASGFLLKTTAPAQLAQAVLACARGETLLSPSVTRRLVEHYVRRNPSPRLPAISALTVREVDVLR